MIKKPHKLLAGDRIGIFVPSSPVKEPFRSQGLARLSEMGFVGQEVEDILSNGGVVAKNPSEGVKDFVGFMENPAVKALWAARGGYGANNMLKYLKNLKEMEPKIVIGSSDVSYLLWYLLDNFNMTVFYGPMLYSSIANGHGDCESLIKVVTGDYSRYLIEGKSLLKEAGDGILTGGCLTNLVSLIGTGYFPNVEGRVLLLEDINERPYKLERMLWQLCNAGVTDKVSGIALGNFPGSFINPQEKTDFLERVYNMLKFYNIPVIYDLKIGHGKDIKTVPLGCLCRIDEKGLSIVEKAVV